MDSYVLACILITVIVFTNKLIESPEILNTIRCNVTLMTEHIFLNCTAIPNELG